MISQGFDEQRERCRLLAPAWGIQVIAARNGYIFVIRE
jgi:hypothetical protein